jgi:hypothetical protein
MAAPAPIPTVLDVSELAADAGTIDALARLQLRARRLGRRVELQGVSDELRDLIGFVGLADVLRVEVRGEAEEREDRVRIEEERELDDPTA